MALCVAASGCTDATPTSDDGSLIPIEAETFEVELPFSEFAADLQTFSGFGDNADLARRYIAFEWGGDLEARTLVRFGELPESVNARPIGSGTAQPDSMYVPVSGELVLQLDTASVRGPQIVSIHAEALESSWDPGSATWEFAVDTVGTRTPWSEPGGGPARPIAVRNWSPSASDTLRFEIDSSTVAEWTDPDRRDTGVRLSTTTSGSRSRVLNASLVVTVRPSINPDTLVITAPASVTSTFVYAPEDPPLTDGFRIGGTPAHRAAFRLTLPDAVDPGPAVCQRIECPVELRPERIVYAGLGFYTHAGVSPGLTPLDSVPVEIRPVLSPDRLPRSPLGCSVLGCLARERVLAPGLFDADVQTPVELTLSSYLRTLLAEPGEGVDPPSSTLSILAGREEPATLEPAVFYGPGSDFEPYLRLILTLSEGLTLP